MTVMLQRMLRIRMIEEEIARRYPEGKMRTPIHLSIGQEAAAVGVSAALGPDDLVVSTHRSHAHYLAKGGSLNALISELYGKSTGCSGGFGGSMHLTDRSCGFVASTSIVGGTVPVGVGLAFAKRLRGEPGSVVIFHGDAAIESGVWHEAANFAALHQLPVLFVCENNRYSCYTHIDERQPPRRTLRPLAEGHGLLYRRTHTDFVAAIERYTRKLLRYGVPALLEIKCERWLEHCGPANDDSLNYRVPPKRQDVLTGMSNVEFSAEIAEAFRLAEEARWPTRMSMYAD